jgi:uncharacterized protein
MKNFHHLILAFFILSLDLTAQHTIESIPNPREASGSWVSNPDQILSGDEINALNVLISSIENSTTIEIAVVVVQSIGDENSKDFVHKLFNYWGIGKKGKDNGLLLLVVMEPKRWEFETGYGLEGDLPDVTLFRIGEQEMVPFFRQGQYGLGILAGIKKVGEILSDPVVAEAFKNNNVITYENQHLVESSSDRSNILYLFFGIASGVIIIVALFRRNKSIKFFKKTKLASVKPINSALFYLILFGFPAIVALNYLTLNALFDANTIFPFILLTYLQILSFTFIDRLNSNRNLKNPDPYQEYLSLKTSHKFIWASLIFFPLPFIPYFIWYRIYKKKLRDKPRVSSSGIPMVRLNETSDDSYLDQGQLLEENLKSIDYDVWVDSGLSERKIEGYKNIFSKYNTCDSCHYETKYLKSDVTISSATYSGTGLKTFSCKNCNHESQATYVIPRKTRSSSSSGSGGSSGGGSFGGGSSGGGGAGGSW